MTLNPVKITLNDNGDYQIELNHDALKDIELSNLGYDPVKNYKNGSTLWRKRKR